MRLNFDGFGVVPGAVPAMANLRDSGSPSVGEHRPVWVCFEFDHRLWLRLSHAGRIEDHRVVTVPDGAHAGWGDFGSDSRLRDFGRDAAAAFTMWGSYEKPADA